jgi:hypothetical protein
MDIAPDCGRAANTVKNGNPASGESIDSTTLIPGFGCPRLAASRGVLCAPRARMSVPPLVSAHLVAFRWSHANFAASATLRIRAGAPRYFVEPARSAAAPR